MRLTRITIILLVVLAGSAVSAFGIDPALSLDQNIVRTWGVDEGLPQGTVYALTQSADGYVWAATQEGFVRFDGVEFSIYDKAASPEIHNNMTLALLSARDGSVYASTNGGGVVHVDGRRLDSYTVANGLPSDSATALLESGDGTIWIGTQRGLARRQSDGRIVTVAGSDAPSPIAVTTLTEDWSGQLWIGTTHGVATFKDGRLVRHDGRQARMRARLTCFSRRAWARRHRPHPRHGSALAGQRLAVRQADPAIWPEGRLSCWTPLIKRYPLQRKARNDSAPGARLPPGLRTPSLYNAFGGPHGQFPAAPRHPHADGGRGERRENSRRGCSIPP